ncbi:MAG: hypothetical protein FWC49_01670, partial [Proteobacteria bacterium]|nr:hypothetical protein [Pseudomonadota bacterium]
ARSEAETRNPDAAWILRLRLTAPRRMTPVFLVQAGRLRNFCQFDLSLFVISTAGRNLHRWEHGDPSSLRSSG